jgi:H+/gluconate symporter-like permease
MFGGGMFWITRRVKKAQAAGEGYGNHLNENIKEIDDDKLPSFFNAMLPIIIVLVVNYILSFIVFANMEAPYLEELYGTSISKVKGSWALIVALVVAILVAIIVNRKNIDDLKKTINDGAMGSLLAIMNTASEVGYGTVIKSLGAFAMVKTAILAIPGTPLISLAVSTSTLAGITGSASGGMSIALAALGETYMAKAQALGINPEAFHRIAAMACGGLDTLPHNGAVITLLAVTQLTHKDSYADLGMCTVVIPLIATAVAIVFATMGVV